VLSLLASGGAGLELLLQGCPNSFLYLYCLHFIIFSFLTDIQGVQTQMLKTIFTFKVMEYMAFKDIISNGEVIFLLI